MFIVAPLGSIQELPAESCEEIKASEGEDAISGNHWLMSMIPGEVFQAPCIKPEGIRCVCPSIITTSLISANKYYKIIQESIGMQQSSF